MNLSADSSPRSAGPMLWLVLGLPAAVIAAGFATLAIAVRAGGADAIPWEVRRTAQIQIEDRSADRRALALGLRAVLGVERDTGAIRVRLDSVDPIDADRLQLALVHPSRAAEDLRIGLVRGGNAWHGRLPTTSATAWTLRLEPDDGGWRLQGRWNAGGHSVLLPVP